VCHVVFVVVAMAQKARRRPVTSEAWVRFRFSPCYYVVHGMALELVFFPRVLPPFLVITPPMLHTHLNVPITKRTNGRSLGTFKRQCRFENNGALYRSILSILLCFFQERNWVPDVYSSLHDAVLKFCWILPIAGGISDTRRFRGWRFSRYSDRLSVLRLMALVGTS